MIVYYILYSDLWALFGDNIWRKSSPRGPKSVASKISHKTVTDTGSLGLCRTEALANSVDSEMLYYVAFHLGIHCFHTSEFLIYKGLSCASIIFEEMSSKIIG